MAGKVNATKFWFPVSHSDPETQKLVENLVREIDMSLKAITPSTITGARILISSGGGSGGSVVSPRTSINIRQAVTAGTITVNFPTLGSTNYGVDAYVMRSSDLFLVVAQPRIPPDVDTRSFSSVQVIVTDTGILSTTITLP